MTLLFGAKNLVLYELCEQFHGNQRVVMCDSGVGRDEVGGLGSEAGGELLLKV